jgi:hypothetical protein
VRRGPRSGEDIQHDQVVAAVADAAESLARVRHPYPQLDGGIPGQRPAHEIHQRPVDLHSALDGPGPRRGDVARQRQGAAAEVQRAQRPSRRCDQVNGGRHPPHVLELQMGRIREIDVRLRRAVEQ